MERRVKLFRNGANQAVRIPREWELPGDEVVLRKDEGKLTIEPVGRRTLLDILDSLEPIDEDIGEIEDFPPEPVEL